MFRFPAIRGFQSAIVVVMLTYAAITVTQSINVWEQMASSRFVQHTAFGESGRFVLSITEDRSIIFIITTMA